MERTVEVIEFTDGAEDAPQGRSVAAQSARAHGQGIRIQEVVQPQGAALAAAIGAMFPEEE